MDNTIIYELPGIIRETASGYVRHTIAEEMLENRQIECAGEITPGLAHGILLQLRHLQAEDGRAEITMYINSPGGSVTAGLAIYDMMEALGCPVHTVCTGLAASMAAVLFMAGCRGKRDMFRHARVMIHDPLLATNAGGPALAVDATAKDLMKTRQLVAQLIAENTGHPIREVLKKTAKDTYFDAEEAVMWGIADRIVGKGKEGDRYGRLQNTG